MGERPLYAGWGGAMPDATPYNQPLAIAGQNFGSGVGVLANSRLEVRNQGFSRFTAKVGVDDSARDAAHPVQLTVYGDGRLLASETARRGEAAKPIDVDVRGVAIVELVALAPNAPGEMLPISWGDAALRR